MAPWTERRPADLLRNGIVLAQGAFVWAGAGAALGQAIAVDQQAFHHALYVVARLQEGDALDPVDRVDIRRARIAISLDPLRHVAAGVVGGEHQDVGAAVMGWTPPITAAFGPAPRDLVLLPNPQGRFDPVHDPGALAH